MCDEIKIWYLSQCNGYAAGWPGRVQLLAGAAIVLFPIASRLALILPSPLFSRYWELFSLGVKRLGC
jgi:hypothetical protein